MTVGVAAIDDGYEHLLKSFVSKWDVADSISDTSCVLMTVRDNPVTIDTADIEACLVYSMSADRRTCLLLLPLELRR